MLPLISAVSVLLIPLIIIIVLVTGMIKKIPLYEKFVEGGREGLGIAASLLPFLLGMLVAIGVFRASGALEAFTNLISPLVIRIGLPPEVIPLALIRPISGNGSLAMMSDLIKNYGPDSFIGMLASTLQGSTDTTFYIITVYFGAVGIRHAGDAVKVGLLADLAGAVAAIVICSLIF